MIAIGMFIYSPLKWLITIPDSIHTNNFALVEKVHHDVTQAVNTEPARVAMHEQFAFTWQKHTAD
jgi:hypothetical protein